ncbi:hypothetical protein ABZ799_01285 [Nocardiopsis dassonvillei]|uniref:hypothetical protein n=1 Tax=Nocardiopsis dassonvillei TaxID=2014 RepID=UPI0034029BD1
MTFQPAAFVDGGPINGVLLRRQLQSATRGASGIVEPVDLAVRPLDVPAAGFVIGDGAAVIRGMDTVWDGSYYALNIGDTIVSDVEGTGSGSGRTDMVVLRVVPGAVVEPYIIQGVPASAMTIAETPEPGLSAIPLARIAYDPSEATITQDMITDLRPLLAPRTQRVLRVMRGGGQEDGRDDAADYKADFERWPQHDWSVTIPAWATQVQVRADWLNVWYPAPVDGTGGNYDARGQVRVGLIGGDPSNILTPATEYNFNATTATNGYRCSIGMAAQVPIPEAMRGTTVQLRMYAKSDADRIHYLVADGWANFSVDLEFLEQAAPEPAL